LIVCHNIYSIPRNKLNVKTDSIHYDLLKCIGIEEYHHPTIFNLILSLFIHSALLRALSWKPYHYSKELRANCPVSIMSGNELINLSGNSGICDWLLTKISRSPCDKCVCKAFSLWFHLHIRVWTFCELRITNGAFLRRFGHFHAWNQFTVFQAQTVAFVPSFITWFFKGKCLSQACVTKTLSRIALSAGLMSSS